jgi:hypothetical protein
MENIGETGQVYEAERQIKIVRTEKAPLESELIDQVELTEVGGHADEEAPAAEAKPLAKIEPARNEMKAGYRYASGLYHEKSA